MPVAFFAGEHERGRLSGIGGQMSVADGRPVEKKPRGTKRKKLEPQAEEPAESRTKPKAASENELYGIDAMRNAAADTLSEKCVLIATKMASEASEEGKVPCARFLCDLADKKKKLTEAQIERITRSLASDWTGEPKWLPVIEDAKGDNRRQLTAQ